MLVWMSQARQWLVTFVKRQEQVARPLQYKSRDRRFFWAVFFSLLITHTLSLPFCLSFPIIPNRSLAHCKSFFHPLFSYLSSSISISSQLKSSHANHKVCCRRRQVSFSSSLSLFPSTGASLLPSEMHSIFFVHGPALAHLCNYKECSPFSLETNLLPLHRSLLFIDGAVGKVFHPLILRYRNCQADIFTEFDFDARPGLVSDRRTKGLDPECSTLEYQLAISTHYHRHQKIQHERWIS